ncbi:response regulator transcription factor [Pseudogemmobacter sp. W21_MBD1_M6]|uniref:response regulator transcription factor n=1 Tax=Pseudogemmobacter sp. W21_MBD1_M6 TaxID=3240271 RepID=UPI003F97FC7C
MLEILIADDHALIRDAIARLIDKEPDMIVSTAGNFSEAAQLLREKGNFDVILLDLDMPGMKGLSSVESVIKMSGTGKVVLFSGFQSNIFISKAIECGAGGYIPKTLPLRSLPSAIRLVSSGETFIPLARRGESGQVFDDAQQLLSEREKYILKATADGLTNKEIAFELKLSEVTIKMCMRTICSKLHAKNRTHASIIAMRDELI